MTEGLPVSLIAVVLLGMLLAAASPQTARAADPAIYDLPSIYSASDTYALKVNGKDVPVVGYNGDYDYAQFSMGDEPVTIEVRALREQSITAHDISPWKLGIKGVVQGNRLRFRLEGDQYLIVRINQLKRLVIIADPAETDVPPRQGEGIFTIGTEGPFAADATGKELATAAIQRAIDAASEFGRANGRQGIVYIPAGVYLIGNLTLRSDTAVYLEGGAVLRCTDDRSQLKGHWRKNSMASEVTWWIHTDVGAKNVKLYGRGTLDGNGWNLWHKNEKGQRMANNLLVPMHVSGFTCDGLIVRDPSAWSIVPVRSDNVTFTNFKMFNRLNMGENDGIDIVESQNVVVRNSIGISLDDPYSFKTWAATTDIALNWEGDPEPNENILVERAISWTHCFGYKVGQGVFQPQRNIIVRDAVVYDSAVALGIHHKYGDALASDIVFEDIEIERQHGHNEAKGTWFAALVDHRNPLGGGPIRNVHLRNIRIHDPGHTPAMLVGLSEKARIDGITFENVYMPGKTTPARTLSEMNVTMRDYHGDVTILPEQGEEPPVRPNIARGKAAKASSIQAEHKPERAVDGNFATRWASDRSDPQWIAIDLGESQRIAGVTLVWENAHARAYEIQVSDDGSKWRPVYRTTSGKGGTEEITFRSPVAGRYVRMHGTQRGTKYGYSLWEFQVHPAEKAVK